MKYFFSILLLYGSFSFLNGQEDERSFSLSGYGEILYQNFDYGPNQRATLNGSKEDNRAIVDIPRIVFEAKYNFVKDMSLVTEIEFEHMGTGSAMELEYEEFGEYEFESEKGGEVLIEELYINKSFSKQFNLRAGRFPIPFTLYNKKHRPTDFFATSFPESESTILPSVWSETGFEVYGKIWNLDYRLAVVNGLDASAFPSERWIAEGYQTRFERVSATNLAGVIRLDYTGINNTMAGGSVYYGNSAGNRPKPEDMAGVDAYVTLFDFHLLYSGNPFIVRGDFIYGNVENSEIISQRNARLSVNTQNSRSPVAKNAVAWYIEGGYNIAPIFNIATVYQFYPFLRYDYYNTMEKVVEGIFANPRFKRSVITAGINFIWNNEIILKIDYSTRRVGEGEFNTENTIGFAIGYNTTFIN